ncbi:hypothetical protein PVAP13_7NG238600 [Panicum virgatum]|uniref:Secreted protein n=1 Tax=Panicum virgatum TaxID=38727 RepID=A0A8T0PYX6_PANVG|nr:hypothetical protein PVAP13_7NG238600 [Panicum virgatum]
MRASAMLHGAKVALAALLAASPAGSLLPPRHCAHRDLSLFFTTIASMPWLGREYLVTRRPVHNILTSIDPHVVCRKVKAIADPMLTLPLFAFATLKIRFSTYFDRTR